ncbi:MAG: hypothetical protein NTX45_26140 [Proteobacteria bacterium]|nr:hypothetical protein [Pseudomonadota bacterium]
MRKIIMASLFVGLALASEYARTQSTAADYPLMPRVAKAPEHDAQAQINQQIVAAIQSGRYADAIQSVRRARVSKAEADFAVGELILQGLADPKSAQHPVESIDEGIALIEKSALAGHRQAISALAATFYTGLRDGATNVVLLAPDAWLNACWEAAKTKPKQSATCIAMRLNPRKAH